MSSQTQAPDAPVREGSRWRHHKPSGEEVAEWFKSVPLDEGMKHEDFVAGVVIIPATEKVKKAHGNGTQDVWEQTFTPYVRVDTRVTYFRKLAELRELIAVIEPIEVPRSESAAFNNTNTPEGFWWHVAGANDAAQRFLCCTMRVALYEKDQWFECGEKPPIPSREGRATKQVAGSPHITGLAKAETGAIGRALGVAGSRIVGTGIATADDMQELRDSPQAGVPTLPQAGTPEETPEALNQRIMALQNTMKTSFPTLWEVISAWWTERAGSEGWTQLSDAPVEVRRGMATRMEDLIEKETAKPTELPPDSSPELESAT